MQAADYMAVAVALLVIAVALIVAVTVLPELEGLEKTLPDTTSEVAAVPEIMVVES